ncbi:hypothetical protein [Exiguobacterium sp. s166]|uniref:hypothetical protein n=1 Tax=Exiguobacterium sp. s166 TaxID=2751204 RepID=UPI001BE5F4A7|nr:hypothetical protein [Exiguobacterium sp. s166]
MNLKKKLAIAGIFVVLGSGLTINSNISYVAKDLLPGEFSVKHVAKDLLPGEFSVKHVAKDLLPGEFTEKNKA